MKRRKILFFITLCVITLTNTTFTQQPGKGKAPAKESGRITGIITDSLTGKPVEYGSFLLYRLRDSALYNGAFTDSTGRFTIENIPSEIYYARITALGYRSRKRNRMSIGAGVAVISLDTIKLVQKSLSTGVVQVIAEKERLVFEEDKVIVNVNRSMGNNASEILENTPMVSVDFDGNVSLQGRQGTVIYIDGVPAKYLGFDKAEDLKLLSISDIEKIELIVNPSVEYNERTTGGVINIVRRKISNTRYSLQTGLSGNTRNHFDSFLGLTGSYRAMFFRGGYSRDYSRFRSSRSLQKEVSLQDKVNHIRQTANSVNKSTTDALILNFGYEPDKINSINSSFSYRGINSGNQSSMENLMNMEGNNYPGSFISDGLKNTRQSFFTYLITYRRLFAEKGRSLSLSFSYSDNAMELDNNSTKLNMTSGEPFLIQNNSSENTNNMYKWMLQYIHPLRKDSKINIGYNGTAKGLSMNNVYSHYNQPKERLTGNAGKDIRSEYTNIDHEASGSFKGALWGVNYDLGLSASYYGLKDRDLISGNSFSSSFLNITPSLILRKNLSSNYTLSCAFTRWIQNPYNKQLNPYVDNTDSTEITMGNPSLKPFTKDQVGLDLRMSSDNSFLGVGTYYYHVSDHIEQITWQENLKTAVTTYRNFGSIDNFGASLNAGDTFLGRLKVEPGISFGKRFYKGFDYDNSNFSWSSSVRSGASFSFLRFQLDFVYNSSSSGIQSKSKATYYANAAVKLLLFDKQLSLTFRASDIFNTKNLNEDVYGKGFYSISSIGEMTRILSLNISYYFQGKANDTLEEPEDNEQYDDF